MPAPRANHAKVYINNVYYGLYTNVEDLNEQFCADKLNSSPNNVFIKCNPKGIAAGGLPGSNSTLPNLSWKSADSTKYYEAYELKSKSGWKDLIHLVDTLNNKTGSIEKILDVDRALWMIAFDNVLVNLDSYLGALTQNYYLFRDDNKRFNTLVWDLNMSFGSFTFLDFAGFPPQTLDTNAVKTMSPLVMATSADRPLMQKLFANNPTYKRKYLAHLKTIALEMFNSDAYFNRIKTLQSKIDAAVKADTNKFYSYADFSRNLLFATLERERVGGPGGGFGGGPAYIVGIKGLMDARMTYLKGTPEFTAIQPSVTTVNAALTTNDTIQITAKIATADTAWVGFRFRQSEIFNRIRLYDDGKNGDGAAGDGIFGAKFKKPSRTSDAQYYVYAENQNAGLFSPQRAEYEFYTLPATTAASITGVVINELLAKNVTIAQDPSGQYDDWAELFNKTNAAIDLSNAYLSDSYAFRKKWQFPVGTSIPANGYLVVWTDKDLSQSGVHANFKLSGSGGQLILSNPVDSSVVDSLSYGLQTNDISLGRFPNGTGAFRTMRPSIRATNLITATAERITEAIKIYPNPTNNTLNISFPASINHLKIEITNILGSVLNVFDAAESASLDVSTFPMGIYLVKFKDDKGRIRVDKFVKN
jgi:hypothetical protein